MLFRNLVSMDVEESIRANPIDGVVLLVGCDKTTPALLMGAASCDLPAIVVSGGPMLNGKFRGQDIGSGTDVWRFSEDVRGRHDGAREFMEAEAGMSRSAGICMTMGTASTMASMVRGLGMALPQNAAHPGGRLAAQALAQWPAGGSSRWCARTSRCRRSSPAKRSRTRFGSTAPSAARPMPSSICWRSPAGSASTLTLEDWDRLGRDVPTIVDLKPSGRFLMEEFYYAGGLPAVMRALGEPGSCTGMR